MIDITINKEHRIQHGLNTIFEDIKSIKTREEYEKSAVYTEYGHEIDRVAEGVEWKNTYTCDETPQIIRVVTWNVERGRELDGILHHIRHNELLAKADILLLPETDIGMGRSGNLNIPLALSNALKMNYCYANFFIELTKGDEGEQEHNLPNALGLHGVSILSKFKIKSYHVEKLPRNNDVFYSKEKRLGQRRGLICKIEISGKDYDFAAMHLDPKSSFKQRAAQMEKVLAAMRESDASAQLIGGDLNSSTYNLKNQFALAGNLLYKIMLVGFNDIIAHYMKPEELFEKPLFNAFKRYGFSYDEYNNQAKGTLNYDVNDPTLVKKTRGYVPDIFIRWLQKKLQPWGGVVPLRLDWFAGKGFEVVQEQNGVYGPPEVIEKLSQNGVPLSDHNPIIVDVRLPL